MATISPLDALLLAIEKAGSQSALARLCGVRQPTVWYWLNRAGGIPARFALVVEAKLGISRHDLCPSTFGPALAPLDHGHRGFAGSTPAALHPFPIQPGANSSALNSPAPCAAIAGA